MKSAMTLDNITKFWTKVDSFYLFRYFSSPVQLFHHLALMNDANV